MERNKFKIKPIVLTFCVLAFGFFLSCNQPILESAECIASRDSIKKFYSFHIGNDMTPSSEYLEKRRQYLSERLAEEIAKANDSKRDYFTQSEDFPKTFRAGACKSVGEDRASFEVVLFWRKAEKNMQQEITVEVVNSGEKWLIDKVGPKN